MHSGSEALVFHFISVSAGLVVMRGFRRLFKALFSPMLEQAGLSLLRLRM
jgi:hypothetical protein